MDATRAGASPSRPSTPAVRQQVYISARLREVLDTRFATGILQVQAPAGCGKTAMLLQFLLDEGVEPHWHTCSAEDAEPANLLTALVKAMGGDAGVAGQTTLAALRSRDIRDTYRVALAPFLEALDDDENRVLVIDDADAILDSSAALEVLDYLISACRPSMRIVLISRAEVPLGSQAKRLLEGRAARVMAEDLLFRPEEIDAFARSVFHVEPSEEDVDRLYRATGGWAIALGLALRLRDLGATMHADEHAQFTPEARTDLFSYLAAEVLSRVDEPARQFLRQTAILDRLDPAVCTRLTGEVRALELIQSLARAGLPILKEGWNAYRCHSLLREYLLDGMSEAEVSEAHSEAAVAYAGLSLWPQALAHFAKAGDTASSLQIIDEHGRELFFSGHGRALLDLVKGAADGLLDEHDAARYWAAFSASRIFELDWAAAAFERVHVNASSRGDVTLAGDALRGLTHLLNGWGRYPAANVAAQRLLDSVPDDDIAGRAAVTLGYLVTGMGATGQFREAVEDVRRLLPDLAVEPRADSLAEAYARSVAAVTLAMEGDFAPARAELNRARVLILGREDDDVHTFVPWSAALVEFIAACPDDADEAALAAETLALQYGDLQRVLECRAVQACTATMRGDVVEADRRFAQLDELRGGGADYWGVVLTLLSRPERARLHGDLAGALAAAEANHALAVSTAGDRFVCSTRLDISYLRLLTGDVPGAQQHARLALTEAHELAASLLMYGANLMLAASSREDEPSAIADALRIADARDYRFLMPYAVRLPQLDAALWRSLGTEGSTRAALLLAAQGPVAADALRPLIRDLDEEALLRAVDVLRRFRPAPRDALNRMTASSHRRVAEAARAALATLEVQNPHGLSPREVEVLELLVQGMRTKEVAERLVLTPATISTHIQRIMHKTGTTSRAELLALAARELGSPS